MTQIALSSEESRIVLEILERFVPQCEVWAFGSRTRSSPKAFADLDLAIFGPLPISIAVLAQLAEAFSESPLPFKVDIVDWATVGEDFRKIADAEKRFFKAASRW